MDGFKKCSSIICATINGELAEVDKLVMEDWIKNVWLDTCSQYSDDDVFIANETGLFYRMMPNVKFKRETYIGGKKGKDRTNVLVCTNITQEERSKLLVKERFKQSRYFKNVKRSVIYKNLDRICH